MAIELKKGDKCIVKGFTGIKLGVFEVAAASKKTITIMKKNGDEMIFDKKTCRQVNVEEGKEKYANSIMEDDGSYTAPNRGARKSADKKTSKKAKKPTPVEEDEDEEEEEEAPAPTKKSSKKAAPAKKSKKAPVIEEDDEDDDDFEEVDD